MDPADRLNRLVRTLKHLLVALAYAVGGMVVGAMGLYAYQVEKWPDLQPWHVASLDEEFRASQADEMTDLDDYRRLETRLFEQLQEQVIAVTPVGKGNRLNRYSAGSLVDPANRPIDWNRTFEMAADNPRGGILMLHGLSDSPYSLRALAKILHEQGFWVVGLRIPGHGTAPAGLTHAAWQDFTAATRIAARHVRQRIGEIGCDAHISARDPARDDAHGLAIDLVALLRQIDGESVARCPRPAQQQGEDDDDACHGLSPAVLPEVDVLTRTV